MLLQVYPRIKASIIVLLFFLLVVLFILISINLFGMAFRKLGFPPEYSIYFLFFSLLGGYVNIPVKKVISRVPVISGQKIDYLFFSYTSSPKEIKDNTIIAINLGGAVIPVIMSVFLSIKVSLVDALIGILVMTILIHKMARPKKGSGIAIHALLPPILATAMALIISPQNAPVIAYVSGTLGCLIGIDILNLKRIPEMGVPVVSIGGAGTFDAIFLTGIISVLLA
ncbi:Uncharacterised protein [uncultured archaeon]|nr:Uncharacterised protein [uncultured archaeon]